MNPNDEVSYNKFIIEKLKCEFEEVLMESQVESILSINTSERRFSKALAIRIKREFFGEKINVKHEVTFAVPSSWWQHFKQSHFPGWLLKRCPVKNTRHTKTVIFDRMFEYPTMYDARHKDLGRFIVHDMTPQVTDLKIKAKVQ